MDLAKDKTKLKGVSDYFTEETLENILCVLHKGKQAVVLNWDFGPASAKGDGYLSTVNRIKVMGIVDGIEKESHLVVKSLPQNKSRRKTFRSAEFFYNEIMFYTKVIPKFEKFLNEKGQRQILCIPQYLDSAVDGENDYIALEDVSLLGYGRLSRENYINIDECIIILQAMAKFHAISFAYKDQYKDEFTETMETLRETYFDQHHWDWYKNFQKTLINVAKNALATEYPGSEAQRRYSSIKFGDLFQMCAEFCKRKYAPTSVINQGDSWAPNFLARNVNGKREALMLDFQLARCASPVLDIAFSLYSCTDKALLDEKFDELLKVYHNELTRTIGLLGSNPEKLYPWDIFMNEVKEQFVFGMTFAMEAIQFAILDETEVFDLDLMKGEEAVDIADVWNLSNIKTKSGRLRLANIIVHCVERGFL